MNKLSAFEPMDNSSINGYCFFCRDIRTIFEIVVLSFLFSFKEQTGESTHILLTDCFVYCSSSSDPFSIEISCIGPPVSLTLHIPQDHILNR